MLPAQWGGGYLLHWQIPQDLHLACPYQGCLATCRSCSWALVRVARGAMAAELLCAAPASEDAAFPLMCNLVRDDHTGIACQHTTGSTRTPSYLPIMDGQAMSPT